MSAGYTIDSLASSNLNRGHHPSPFSTLRASGGKPPIQKERRVPHIALAKGGRIPKPPLAFNRGSLTFSRFVKVGPDFSTL